MKRKNIYIIIFVFTTITAVCIAIYFKVNSNTKINNLEKELGEAKNKIQQIELEEKNNDIMSNSEEKIEEIRPKIDENNCINKAENTAYYVRRNVNFNNALKCYLEHDGSVKIEVNYDNISTIYGNYVEINKSNNTTTKLEDFDKNVVDVYIGGFGHTVGNEVLFFLLEDGTVEFMPIAHALQNNTIKSYGKLDGVSDVIEFITGNANIVNGSGWATTYAVRKDGSFYDLNTIINLKDNNYEIKYSWE